MSARFGGVSEHAHLTAAAAANVKLGPGILKRVIINTTAAGTITIRDAITDTTPVIAVITMDADTGPVSLEFDLQFIVGLRVTPSATCDITVVYS